MFLGGQPVFSAASHRPGQPLANEYHGFTTIGTDLECIRIVFEK